jgi:chromosome segregation ATPase
MSQEALKTALQETCAQRDTFKEHAEALTQEVLRLREQLGSHVAHTREAEQEHTAARAQWASKLEQAQRDFSEMLSREELESMRLQLIEQTEAPWRARVKALEAEVMAAREQANGHRRDAEKARSTADWAMHEHRATLREHEARAESEIAELKAKLEIAESIKAANEERAGGADRTRRLQREHAEATIRCQKLLEEVEELRRENDVLIATRSQLLGAQGSLQGESAAQAAQYVESGAAEVGILPLALAKGTRLTERGRFWVVPADAHPPIRHGGAIHARAIDREATVAFRDFLLAPAGRAILARYGFEFPAVP